jgi:acylphosphatase
MKQQKKFHVSGHVQGVGFRYFVWQVARKNEVVGFARNETDDTVTVMVEGSESALILLEAALWKGSPMSHVTSVTDSEITIKETFTIFSIC